jgi:glycosyltransferase 2 family protein
VSARRRVKRLLSWAVALAALAFVAWMVPLRDRCWDPRAPTSTRVAVTRSAGGCVLHLRTGDVVVDSAACAQLKCEPGVVSTFAHARLALVAALLGLYVLGTLAWAARWRALLSFAGIDLPLLQVWRLSTEAQAGGILLPGGIGGDALRVTGVLARPTREGEARAPASTVIASVVLDRAVGISLIAGLAAVLGVTSGGVGAGPLVGALAAIPVGVVAGLVVMRSAPLHRIRRLSEGRIGNVARPVLAYVRDPRAPRAIVLAAAFSAVVAAIQFAVIRGLVFALGAAPTGEKWLYVGTAMAFIVGAVPALPGGWGTADAAYVFFFGLAGVASGAALAVCLVFRLFWYACGVAGALLYVARPPAIEPPVVAGPDG